MNNHQEMKNKFEPKKTLWLGSGRWVIDHPLGRMDKEMSYYFLTLDHGRVQSNRLRSSTYIP
jgi:hypothetical protein